MKATVHPLAAIPLAICLSLFSIHPIAAAAPVNLAVSNVRDNSFTVSWLTTIIESGRVQLIGGAIYEDERGTDFSGTTHYVSISGLRTNSTYYFEIISGGKKYDNGGARWLVKTGVTLAPRPPDWIGGRVQNPDGSVATEAIVSTTIGREQQGYISAPLSTLVTARDGGFFRINLGETRAFADPTNFFAYSIQGDRPMNNNVTIQAIAASGAEAFMLDMADPRLRAKDPAQSLVVKLSEGAVIPTPVISLSVAPRDTPNFNMGVLLLGVAIAGIGVLGAVIVRLVARRR